MQKTTFNNLPVYYSEQFRTPLKAEKKIGLWVDRIGRKAERKSRIPGLRILGQFGVVHIEKGKGYFISKSTGEISIRQGDTIVLLPDEPHCYYSDKQWTERWIVWNGPHAHLLADLGLLNKTVIIDDYNEAVLKAHRQLAKLMNEESIDAIFERKLIILEMIRSLHNSSQLKRSDDSYIRCLTDVMDYIKVNYNKDIYTEELAKYAHLSSSHFRRLFKLHTGRSPKQFITSLRISKAKQLLAKGYSIKQTANIVGYDDVIYFMKVFKKTVGMSAGVFSRNVHT